MSEASGEMCRQQRFVRVSQGRVLADGKLVVQLHLDRVVRTHLHPLVFLRSARRFNMPRALALQRHGHTCTHEHVNIWQWGKRGKFWVVGHSGPRSAILPMCARGLLTHVLAHPARATSTPSGNAMAIPPRMRKAIHTSRRARGVFARPPSFSSKRPVVIGGTHRRWPGRAGGHLGSILALLGRCPGWTLVDELINNPSARRPIVHQCRCGRTTGCGTNAEGEQTAQKHARRLSRGPTRPSSVTNCAERQCARASSTASLQK